MTDTNDDAPRSPGETPHAPNQPVPSQPVPSQPTPGQPAPSEPPAEAERIAKAIARAGIASRRDAEAMILAGRVTLNGDILASPAINVTAADRITIDGEPLPARERTRLWILHKPRGVVTTARDPEGRATVFDGLPEDLPRVVAIGRLDINTEGLLLLTNDGGLAKVVAHPDTGWLRRYRVRAYGETDQAALDRLRGGVTIEGMEYGPIEASLDRVQGDNLWLTLGLREGKNREVKRILEHLGLSVNRLIRLSFGPFQLGDLEVGLVEEVRTRVLKDQLGQSLAEAAGVDFESPVREAIAPFGRPTAPAGRPAGRGDGERPRTAATSRDAGRPRRDEGGRETRGAPRRDAPGRGAPAWGRRDEGPRGVRERPAGSRDAPAGRPAARNAGPKRSVWRADAEAEGPGKARPPRRGADARAERSLSGERPRERVGAIASGPRKVLVERVVTERAEPAPSPRPDRRSGPGERAPRTGFRDRAPAPGGEAPHRRGPGDWAPTGRESDQNAGDDRRRTRPADETAPRRGPPRGETGRPRDAGDRGRGDAGPGRRPSGPDGPRSFGDRPAGGKAFGAKSFGAKSFGAKPFGAKPFGAKPAGGRPAGGKPFGAKPFGAKSSGAKSFGARPSGAGPSGAGPSGDRPSGGKPFRGRPSGGARPDGPRGGPAGKPRGGAPRRDR